MASTTAKVLQSPNFPENYPNSLDCTWNIIANKGEHVLIRFEFIKLEENYDKLIVCNGMPCSTLLALADISGKTYITTSNL